MNSLKPEFIIKFGKNYGLALAEIYQYQPSYIEWAILNVDDFKIDMDEFEKLPTPTTIGYKSSSFSGQKKNLEFKIENLGELIANSDTINVLTCVQDVKNLIKEGWKIEEFTEFKFPENIKAVNNKK